MHVGETKITAREDPLQAAAYEQSLKRRPAPFVVQWRKQSGAGGAKSKGKGAAEDATGELVIAVNPAGAYTRPLVSLACAASVTIRLTPPNVTHKELIMLSRKLDE